MRPVIGLICCNEVSERPIQAVASRFIQPLSTLSGASVLLVPAMIEAVDLDALPQRLDGLLLTGSRSHVAPWRYGGDDREDMPRDERRDAVALALADRMIEAGRPVFGICRGLQELNVLFGGTLTEALPAHHHSEDVPFEALFEHDHEVALVDTGMLADATGAARLTVNSVHRQGIDRLGTGLAVEARATDDDLIEAFSARPHRAPVLGVQWHPEWGGAARPDGQAFFHLIGNALQGGYGAAAPRMPLRGH
jgi:putative glutamine amidotransferase